MLLCHTERPHDSAPEEPLPSIGAASLIFKNVHLGGSLIGSPNTIKEMLQLASEANVRSWVQEVPMDKVNEAVVNMEDGKARYRYVLVNGKHQSLA
jgi:alcohol dehydrogenase (NADP+)